MDNQKTDQPLLPKGIFSHPLSKEIGLILLLKLILIFIIKTFFFSSPTEVTSERMQEKLFTPSAVEQNGNESENHIEIQPISKYKEKAHDL